MLGYYRPEYDSFTLSTLMNSNTTALYRCGNSILRDTLLVLQCSNIQLKLRTGRFGSVLSNFKKKCEKTNIRPFSNRTKTSHSSLESSHRDASNGGKIKSLALIDRTITHGEYFLKIRISKRSIDARDMNLPPLDAPQRDESNEL